MLRKILGLVRPEFQQRHKRTRVKILRISRVFCDAKLTLGDRIYVGPNCMIKAEGCISIGDGSILAPEVVILSSTHDYNAGALLPFDVYERHRKVTIGRAVWIGYRALICLGV